jgi:hypothetical protein
MVDIQVTRAEARGDLPPLCVCCGAAATTRYRIRVPSAPGEFPTPSSPVTDLLVSAVADGVNEQALGTILKETARPYIPVSLPLCPVHEAVRQRRAWISRAVALASAFLLLQASAGGVALWLLHARGQWLAWLPVSSATLAMLALLAACAAWLVKWQPVGVYAGPLYTLAGVHSRFAQALQEQRSRIAAQTNGVAPADDSEPFRWD